MTIKKRLTLSNIIMIVSLIGAIAVFGIGSLVTVYCTLHGGNGLSFKESADFRRTVSMLSGVIIAAASVLTVLITNHLLNNFVFKKIARPLDLLSHGVSEISKGNLDYRLSYKENDEFRPVP